MKKGFTLLELVVVIIILGVLATLGLTQYGSMVERARSAEARQILGDIRKFALAYRLANGSITGMTNADVNIGTGTDQIPRYCTGTHYFYYSISSAIDPTIQITTYRCTSGGKSPQGTCVAAYLLSENLATGEMVKQWTPCYPGTPWMEGW